MALNGTFYGATTNERVKPKIVWSAVQNTQGNYSDVTATLYYSRTNTGYETAGLWQGGITIDGNTKEESKNISVTYESNTQAITHTVRVYHDSYGAKKITISATGSIGISTVSATEISAVVTLDTIALASAVSGTSGNIGSRVTVVIDRKNTGFTHSLQYRFGSLTGYIRSDGAVSSQEQKMTATTVNFLLPESFYGQIPNSVSGACQLTCNTYSGSSLVGSTTATLTAVADKSLCAPEVSGSVTDTNTKTVALTGNSAVLVAGYSTAKCVITATAKNSAVIKEKSIGGGVVTGNERTIANIRTGALTFAATDSRGYRTEIAVKPTFIPYVNLTCNASVRRPNPTGTTAQLTLQGRCYKGGFGAKNNALQVSYKVGNQAVQTVSVELKSDNTYQKTVTLTGLDYTQSESISVTAKDELSAVTKTLQLQRGLPVFDWGKNDFAFHVPASGNFQGSFGGVYLAKALQDGETSLQLQSCYPAFNESYGSKQTIFLFGTANRVPVWGMLTILASGEDPLWSGTGDLTATALDGGKVQLTLPNSAWDSFTFLSAYEFKLL